VADDLSNVHLPWSLGAPLCASSLALVLVLAGCGSGNTAVDLPPEAAPGRAVYVDAGCAACHGSDASGGVGPALTGLFGSEVELADGSVVVADEAYLRESITEPGAKRVGGSSLQMPTNSLDDEQVAQLVDYLRALPEQP
jgi:mono/diheme cytochrome c family protein